MKAHQPILSRVGTTLVLLGVIEIALSIWQFFCTIPSSPEVHRIALFLPFLLMTLVWAGLFFITPGILLLRNGLSTAKYLRYLALFVLASGGITLLLWPFLRPLDYNLLALRLTPGTLALEIWGDIVYLAFGFWLQYLLGRREILDAQVDARITPASTAPPVWIGAICALGIMGLTYWSLHGGDANKAIQLVRNKLGNNYQYFANNIHWDLADQIKVQVVVVGYNSKEIKRVDVHWAETDSEAGN